MSKRIVAVNDISCYGKCSLTVAFPALSVMGFEVCPVPTALLSAHTGIEGYSFLDLTDEMEKILSHFREMSLGIDGVMSGFLGDIRQIDTVRGFIENIGSISLVDPVMGDDGKLYPTVSGEMCRRIRSLASVADVITPNLTEACVLLGIPYPDNGRLDREDAKSLAGRLAENIPVKSAVITGIRCEDMICNAVYDSTSGLSELIGNRLLEYTISGSGDLFSAVLLGKLCSDKDIFSAVRETGDFVCDCIRNTVMTVGRDKPLEFETLLGRLLPR